MNILKNLFLFNRKSKKNEEFIPGLVDEYIEISKSFFEGEEPNFINGILDKISKIYRPNEF